MNKNGFTLMELLVVISILVITSVSATLVFDTATSSTEKEDTRRFLENLGFVVGGAVTVVSDIGGNLIVNVKESRVAIGKDMANKIMV